MSKRQKIVKVLTELINTNLDGTLYTSNIYGEAENTLKFWDEIGSFPYISIVAGDEYREYQPGNFKWAFLNCIVRVYTKSEEPDIEMEQFFEDIEDLLDKNNNIEYETGEELTSITFTSITTDEGVLRPLAVGEINIQVRYALQGACPI